MGNTSDCEQNSFDYFMVKVDEENRPYYDEKEENFIIDREIAFLEEKSNRDKINKKKQSQREGDHMLTLCDKDMIKRDTELCLVDSAFSNIVEYGFYTNELFALNGNLYSEEEMAAALDLTELYIINQSSYAVKMFIVDRLNLYLKFAFDIKAVIALVSSLLINIDAQLGYDDLDSSLNSNFENIVTVNIYYKDIQELELSALMWISLSDEERIHIQKEIFKIQKNDYLYFEHSKEINIEGIDSFELVVKNKNTLEIQDMEINFYLSALELEFEKFANENPFLLSPTELSSALEIAELTVIEHLKQELLKDKLEILTKQKYIRGEHIVSVFQSAVRVLKKAEAKIHIDWHLAKLLNKLAFENYFDLIDNKIKFSLINDICMNESTKAIIKKQLKTANFKLAKQKGYLCSEYSNSKYNEYFSKEEFLFKIFTNQETKTNYHTR